jgi:hypothetical protein
MYYYKVWSKNRSHLWDYVDFVKEVDAKVVSFSNDQNVVNFIIYQTPNIVEKDVFDSFNFDFCHLDDYIHID